MGSLSKEGKGQAVGWGVEEGRGRLQTGKAKEFQSLAWRPHSPAHYRLVRGAGGSSENSCLDLYGQKYLTSLLYPHKSPQLCDVFPRSLASPAPVSP